jgi:hypothetical protein
VARRTSCGFHVGGVDVLARALDVDHRATEASGLAACDLGGQLASRIPHRVFPGCLGAVLPIFVEVGLSAIGEKDPPGFLEVEARQAFLSGIRIEAAGEDGRGL